MNPRNVLASLLCASLASLAPTSAHAQLSPAGLSAAGQVATALAWTAEPINTSVLGLRSDDKEAGEALTNALREAFAEREMSGGQELSLEEVILTLDCSSEEDTACMTEAGRALETERLVYGTLVAGTLVVDVLDVTTGQIEANVEMPIDDVDLAPENVDATAAEIVNSLYPQADPAVIAATPVADDKQEDTNVANGVEADDGRSSTLVWGPYRPRPAWKKVGLGVSATLLIAGIGTATAGWLYAKEHEPQVVEAMMRLGDNTAGEEADDYCRRKLADEDASMVADPRRSYKCQSLIGGQNVFRAGLGVTVAAGISTVVFTVLYFVHRDDTPTGSAARRPTFMLTGGPTAGGAMLGGTGRF
ncbi:MAG: hypothetical protein ACE37F_05385 [Nannocystaceae bacterium]|nr:hypothetical protein [bacterium]